ncbi:MAG TPA: hypothetical protein DIT13_14600 [Verrucomicrobiales bacterium]|nr:hypothetical protein [Verrucomicrobiales bacterium]HRJ11485.1 nucleotidyl transferase AbiEii/AbiGii toxin family protein [Prosthecobacter sp.]HRK15453.1 nucleotidyl transferase AbiEii/AbiGii toxin family protein [Prosthecobacter sp.]
MLRPDTLELWQFLENQPALQGFVLVGGSALALRIRHRVSEDLDFAWPGLKLPRARLEALLHLSDGKGFHARRRDDPGALDEFEIAGMDLHDYQQDFLVNERVKLSFFAADEGLVRILSSTGEEAVRVATLDELFASKALVTAQRSKTRDWFDLFVLMTRHGKTLEDMRAVFQKAGMSMQFDTALQRLCSGQPSKHDEGYEHLMENPPSLEEMTRFFRAERDAYEQRQAAERGKNVR